MSEISNIQRALTSMLRNKTATIISLSGNWGVGKSYFWFKYIKNEVKIKLIPRTKYSYVSLFGINSLSELKEAIFENSVPIDKAGEITTFKSFAENLKTPISELGGGLRSLFSVISNMPQVKDYSSIAFKALYLTVNNTLICIDDLERKGNDLRIRDVLGLASELKERRNCQIIFIMNKDQLDDEEDYKKFNEKVIDYEYYFSRTSEEVFEIGFPKENILYDFYLQKIKNLKLKNIRVINKLAYYDEIVSKLCKGLHDDVHIEAAGALPLLVAAHYSSDNKSIPDVEFLRNRSEWDFLAEKEVSEEDKILNSVLDDYGWSHFSELDEMLNTMVVNGYANESGLLNIFKKNHVMYEKGVKKQEIQKLWIQYRSSFNDKDDEFINNMMDTYKLHIEVVDVGDINNIVWLLRSLNQESDADAMIKIYLDVHKEFIQSPEFDESSYPGHKPHDKQLGDGISNLISEVCDNRSLESVMDLFSRLDGYGRKDEEYLDKVTEDQFYDFFCDVNNERLPGYVSRMLEFSNYGEGNVLKKCGIRAIMALQRMRGKSKLTDLKLKQMGIKLDNVDEDKVID